MQLETRAGRITIIDRSDALRLRLYLNAEQRRLTGPVKSLWKAQAALIDIETTKKAVDYGTVPLEWSTPWEEMIREFVGDSVVRAWMKSMGDSGDKVARKVNRIQWKAFEFGAAMRAVKAWIDDHGGKLIVNLTAAQIGSIHALIQSQITWGVTSPYIMAERLRPLVGLTMREADAVGKVLATLTEDGMSASAINARVEKYAQHLHKNRAFRIARTEISNAYNFGQRESLQQAADAGWLPGEPWKAWIAGGSNPCEDCLDNEAAGEIALASEFPSGHMEPTAHPQCECALGMGVKR